MRVAGKKALVTGAAQGLGAAIALKLAQHGAKVLLTDINLAGAEAQAEAINAECGAGTAFACAHDVTSEAQWQAALALAQDRFGGLSVLVNNAGIGRGGTVETTSLDLWEQTMAINSTGPFLGIKHALPLLRESQPASIVNISSIAALENYPWVAYKASKSAMIAYTRQLAIQNAEYGVRANVILPGLMDTPMAVDTRARAWNRPRSEIAAERNARVPLRNKMGSAWDVAHAALFLASDEAGFITGVALPVDGGASCKVG